MPSPLSILCAIFLPVNQLCGTLDIIQAKYLDVGFIFKVFCECLVFRKIAKTASQDLLNMGLTEHSEERCSFPCHFPEQGSSPVCEQSGQDYSQPQKFSLHCCISLIHLFTSTSLSPVSQSLILWHLLYPAWFLLCTCQSVKHTLSVISMQSPCWKFCNFPLSYRVVQVH